MSVPTVHLVVTGFKECPYFVKAVAETKKYSEANPEKLSYEVKTIEHGTAWQEARVKFLKDLNKSGDSHKTCPLVFTSYKNKPCDFIGGCDDTCAYLKTNFTL